MPTLTKFNSFVENLAEKVHNLGSDQLKVALTNTLPVVANTVLTDITEILYTNFVNGATTGRNITTTTSAQTSGTYKLVLADLVLTGVTAATPSFRYVVLYNDTATNDELIGFYDYGSSITLNPAETLTIDFDAALGVLTLA